MTEGGVDSAGVISEVSVTYCRSLYLRAFFCYFFISASNVGTSERKSINWSEDIYFDLKSRGLDSTICVCGRVCVCVCVGGLQSPVNIPLCSALLRHASAVSTFDHIWCSSAFAYQPCKATSPLPLHWPEGRLFAQWIVG